MYSSTGAVPLACGAIPFSVTYVEFFSCRGSYDWSRRQSFVFMYVCMMHLPPQLGPPRDGGFRGRGGSLGEAENSRTCGAGSKWRTRHKASLDTNQNDSSSPGGVNNAADWLAVFGESWISLPHARWDRCVQHARKCLLDQWCTYVKGGHPTVRVRCRRSVRRGRGGGGQSGERGDDDAM